MPASPTRRALHRRARTTGRRRPVTVAVTLLLLAGALLAGCGEDQTGRPGTPDVDFDPRLVIEVDDGDLDVAVGPRGADDPAVSADPARVPSGSVIEVRFSGADEQRVVGHLTRPGEEAPDLDDPDVATPAPVVDTGSQPDGGTVTVVLTEAGSVDLRDHDGRGDPLTIEVTARPT